MQFGPIAQLKMLCVRPQMRVTDEDILAAARFARREAKRLRLDPGPAINRAASVFGVEPWAILLYYGVARP